MQFNSFQFLWFFAAVFVLYWRLGHQGQNRLLLVASYFFYGSWDWRFLGLLGGTTLIDYAVARAVDASDDESRRRRILLVSIVANLGVLAVFKYFHFFQDSAVSFAERFGWHVSPTTLKIALPVGISFITFQSMAYTIDVFRRRIPASRSLPEFALYVSYFPPLVAGPIERGAHLMPQLRRERPRLNAATVESGLLLIVLGLVRKVVIADMAAPIVARIYSNDVGNDWRSLVVATVAFAIQIYGDFSGYTSIARGISRLLGIELLQNFRQPYLSANITEFWQRWHISLSGWLRDYLYIPLGGNKRGNGRTYVNLMTVMVLGGLWHGASNTFIIWGAIHGGMLAFHRWVQPNARSTVDEPLQFRRVPGILLTFAAVNVAWVFFRADSAHQAFRILHRIITLQPGFIDYHDVVTVAMLGLAVLAIDLLERRYEPIAPSPRRTLTIGAALGVGMALVLVASGSDVVPFIYFRF